MLVAKEGKTLLNDAKAIEDMVKANEAFGDKYEIAKWHFEGSMQNSIYDIVDATESETIELTKHRIYQKCPLFARDGYNIRVLALHKVQYGIIEVLVKEVYASGAKFDKTMRLTDFGIYELKSIYDFVIHIVKDDFR